ncbi:family 16 glycosylhydrolase [Pelagicoccus mobilis]|uniref:Family 16 glycosylhydrolase n=1 Tax=Pelagicoccus mobilis TaxID=415221 RepID=A0A934VNI3_9BACT|nr:family 16 glycosylhydrolase [Pelagicoccus mobilis]MBK1876247.1 family 16 glycosylhydrolase [Pelagicoccus mobilis]
MKRLPIYTLAAALCAGTLMAIPPQPPEGYRWVINEQFSDNFDGDKLDSSKWMDHYNGGWKGRAPAWFNPDAVSVEGGLLRIRSGTLDKPKGRKGEFTMYGGAVSSKTRGAHFGYYECRAKASRIGMSTTFWLSNQKEPFTEKGDCKTDTYSQELDIQEAVGGNAAFPKFESSMNSNTHFRYVKCGAKKEEFISEGLSVELDSPVYADYHVYGAWWKNENEAAFYANDKHTETVAFRTDVSDRPFDRPMQINMVVETYDWQPPPTAEELENAEINTALYDWVRSYELVPIGEEAKMTPEFKVFEETVEFSTEAEIDRLSIAYSYKANEDCFLDLTLEAVDGDVLRHRKISAYQGFGHDTYLEMIKPELVESITIKLISKSSGRVLATANTDS